MTPKVPEKKLRLKGPAGKSQPNMSFKPASAGGDRPAESRAPSGLASMSQPPPGLQLKSATLRLPNANSTQPGMHASVAPATGQVRFQPGVISTADRLQERDGLLNIVASRQAAATGPIPKASQERQQPPEPAPVLFSGNAIDISVVNESLQNYLDICDMTLRSWTPMTIVDSIHILVKSLGLDVLSLALIDPDRPGKLLPVISRGYNNSPNAALAAIWESCVSPGQGINWKRLMDATSKPDAPLAMWVPAEGLVKFGYAPIHDGKTIHGFLVIGSYDSSKILPVAGSFLEMLGGRLGLSIAIQRNRGEWPATVIKTVRTLRDCLSLQMGIVDMLRESSKLSQDELSSLLDNGAHSLSESASVLDRLIEEASSSKAGS